MDSKFLEKKLSAVKDSSEDIQALSRWCIQNKTHHHSIVQAWSRAVRKAKVGHRLTLFYVCNDIVQNARRKKCLNLVQYFGTAIKETVPLVRDEKIRMKIKRIFNIWEERGIYDAKLIAEFLEIAENVGTVNASENEVVLSSFQLVKLVEGMRNLVALERTSECLLADLKTQDYLLTPEEIARIQENVKERGGSREKLEEFEDAVLSLECYVTSVQKEIEERTRVVTLLEQAEIFYETQRGEAKLVASAYKNFSNQVTILKSKLDEEPPIDKAPSPAPITTLDAPSPSDSDGGVEILDGESLGLDAQVQSKSGLDSFMDSGKIATLAKEAFLCENNTATNGIDKSSEIRERRKSGSPYSSTSRKRLSPDSRISSSGYSHDSTSRNQLSQESSKGSSSYESSYSHHESASRSSHSQSRSSSSRDSKRESSSISHESSKRRRSSSIRESDLDREQREFELQLSKITAHSKSFLDASSGKDSSYKEPRPMGAKELFDTFGKTISSNNSSSIPSGVPPPQTHILPPLPPLPAHPPPPITAPSHPPPITAPSHPPPPITAPSHLPPPISISSLPHHSSPSILPIPLPPNKPLDPFCPPPPNYPPPPMNPTGNPPIWNQPPPPPPPLPPSEPVQMEDDWGEFEDEVETDNRNWGELPGTEELEALGEDAPLSPLPPNDDSPEKTFFLPGGIFDQIRPAKDTGHINPQGRKDNRSLDYSCFDYRALGQDLPLDVSQPVPFELKGDIDLRIRNRKNLWRSDVAISKDKSSLQKALDDASGSDMDISSDSSDIMAGEINKKRKHKRKETQNSVDLKPASSGGPARDKIEHGGAHKPVSFALARQRTIVSLIQEEDEEPKVRLPLLEDEKIDTREKNEPKGRQEEEEEEKERRNTPPPFLDTSILKDVDQISKALKTIRDSAAKPTMHGQSDAKDLDLRGAKSLMDVLRESQNQESTISDDLKDKVSSSPTQTIQSFISTIRSSDLGLMDPTEDSFENREFHEANLSSRNVSLAVSPAMDNGGQQIPLVYGDQARNERDWNAKPHSRMESRVSEWSPDPPVNREPNWTVSEFTPEKSNSRRELEPRLDSHLEDPDWGNHPPPIMNRELTPAQSSVNPERMPPLLSDPVSTHNDPHHQLLQTREFKTQESPILRRGLWGPRPNFSRQPPGGPPFNPRNPIIRGRGNRPYFRPAFEPPPLRNFHLPQGERGHFRGPRRGRAARNW